MNFKGFRKFVIKNRKDIVVKGTYPEWPYNYGTRTAYIVTLKKVTQYFYFREDGQLIDRKLLTDDR